MPQPIIMPIAEVVDRWTIAKLKLERLTDEDPIILKQQVDYYAVGLDFTDDLLSEFARQLYEVNSQMWHAEYAIRLGQDLALGLEEIGRRALHIRDLNLLRCRIKNEIVGHTKSGFREVKMNYAHPEAQQTQAT